MYTVGGETEIFHRPEITYHPGNVGEKNLSTWYQSSTQWRDVRLIIHISLIHSFLTFVIVDDTIVFVIFVNFNFQYLKSIILKSNYMIIFFTTENLAAGVGRPGEDYPEGVGTLIEASQ